MLASLRKWLEIFRSAYSNWTTTIGTILATIALCNLLFRAMDVPLIESLAWILSAYRKTFHPPIDYLLSIFSIRLPTAGKDALVLYLAVSGILYRTLSYDRPSPLKDRFPVTWRTRVWDLRMLATTILVAVLWPYFLKGLLRYPCLLITSRQGYHGRMPPPRRDLSPVRRKEVMDESLAYIGEDAAVICNERELLASYAIGLLAAVISLVGLNAAIDRLGAAF